MFMNLGELKNENCLVKFTNFHDKKQITCDDLTDQNNLPCCFTQNVRGVDKAWEEIENQFNKNTKMGDIFDIMRDFKLKPHQYCRMD